MLLKFISALLQRVSFVLLILILYANLLTESNGQTKKGGICFRVDDNHSMEKYNAYAQKFNKYNKNFCFALNLGLEEFDSVDYRNGVKQLQIYGHELLDHTPVHRTSFFQTRFDPMLYSSIDGVDHVNDNKICLKYDENINIIKAERNGYVDINGNNIISNTNEFSNFTSSEHYLYFPDLQPTKLVLIKKIVNAGSLKVMDAWMDIVNLGNHDNVKYYSFTVFHIHLTIEALNVLANETRKLADYFGIKRPSGWIQPGISSYYFPYVYASEIKQSFGTNFNYISAAVYPYTSEKTYKVFNEYDPNNEKRFGMQWGDFNVDSDSLQKTKTIIANGIAKHKVLIGSSHFTNLLGGWDAYLIRVDSILAWCTRNNIPVKIYAEWSDILYSNIPNQEENIFPPLYIDLDENGMPDGFNKKSKSNGEWITCEGKLLKNDGVAESKNHSFSINKTGYICYVGRKYSWENDGLGGIEKGKNNFEIWTKGAEGNFIEVDFKIGNNHEVYKFPAENTIWTKYNLAQSVNGNTTLNIPEKISFIDVTISCSDYSSGEVKISGMKLLKSSSQENYLSVSPNFLNVSAVNDSISFFVSSNQKWQVTEDIDWLSVNTVYGSNNDSVKINFLQNNSTQNREGFIYIFNSIDTSIVTINQAGLPLVSISVSIDTIEAGKITGYGEYIYGDTVKLIATPNSGWQFLSWNEDTTIVSTDSIYIFTALSSRNLIAKFKSLPTSILKIKNVPYKFYLYQNYPNPFNPTTTIQFELPRTSFVELTIHNITGEIITTLVNKKLASGIYEIKFNGKYLPSGIYLYNIKAGTFNQTRKFILLK